jgi:DNA-binding NtrC family response regulator
MLAPRYTVTIAESIEDAVEALDSQPFAALVTDYELGHPNKTGDWLLGHATTAAPNVRRVLISGHPQSLADARESGRAHETLSKPFNRTALLEALGGD